jgi:hypothetical protein
MRSAGWTATQTPIGPWPPIANEPAEMACFEHAPRADAAQFVGVELQHVITPQNFLPDRSSEWARLHFAGRKGGFELVVGRMIGNVKGAEERERAMGPSQERPPFNGPWRGGARSIWLRGLFEMTARLDADELTHALDRDPQLANAQGWASERGRCPGLASTASPRATPSFHGPSRNALRAFDADAKKLEFDIDVCLQATGKVSPS